MKKTLAALLLIGLTAALVWVVERRVAAPGNQSVSVTIVIDGTPQTLDPTLMTEVMSATLGNACHCPLVRLAADGSVQAELAESVDVAADGMSAKVKLKTGAKFWDQSPVTSSDVAWSLLRLRDSQSPLKLTLERVASCEAENDTTLNVKFSQPEPDFVQMLAHLQAAILKKDSDKAAALPLAQHLIGAGAFCPDSFQPGTQYSFRRNPGFFAPSNIEKLSFIVKTDPQSQLAACRAGDAQIIRLKGPALREAVDFTAKNAAKIHSTIPGFTLLSQTANELNLAILNWNAPPLNQVPVADRAGKVRSLSSNMERSALATALAGVEPASSVIPSAALSRPLEPENASNSEGGKPSLPKIELLCSTDPMSREAAGAAQPYLRSAGLETEVRQLDPARLIEMVLKKQHQAVILDFEMPVVGVSPWLLFFTPGPFSAFGEELAPLGTEANKARSELDPAAREEAWARVAAQLDAQQTSWLPLVSRSTYLLHHESITGVKIDAAGTPYWTHLRLAK